MWPENYACDLDDLVKPVPNTFLMKSKYIMCLEWVPFLFTISALLDNQKHCGSGNVLTSLPLSRST